MHIGLMFLAQVKRRDELNAEVQKLMQTYAPFANAASNGKLTDEEKKEFEAIQAKYTALMEELTPLQPSNYTYHGNVWVFLRQ